MKKLIIIFGLLTIGSAQDIQHAPTIEQCRADRRLWNSQDLQSKDAFNDLTSNQITARANEMRHCAAVDPQEEQRYWMLVAEFVTINGERMFDFVARHGLQQQFLDEEAKGAR